MMKLGRRRSGLALIMALVMLAVMMLLLLALFEGVIHQTRGSQGDAAMAREKMLADTAVGLVIGQIQQASAATQSGRTWISQPGLLRTYAATSTRTPIACYKLYSALSPMAMIDTSGTLSFVATDVPTNWSSQPSAYTDLNASAQMPGLFGTTLYPIFNPAAATAVQGVSVDPGHVAEMPVAWMYEMQDGTLGPASLGTKANPIVGRIAFWTDDDTSKIDINTAGCGDSWNTPRINSTDDVAWSANQPVAGEYSGYPGHPATTSLNVVFGSGSSPPTSQQAQKFLGMSPRYAWGGTQFGTQPAIAGQTLAPKTDRMYTSLDELVFSSTASGGQRTANPITASQLDVARFVLTAHSESPETTMLGEPRVAIWPVSDGTAGAPGITATDRAIMSAATVGTGTSSVRDYYFQRDNPLNPLDDFAFTPPPAAGSATASNVALFNDLWARGNLSLPGWGATLAAKYPDPAWTQILLEITDFIHGLNAVDPNPSLQPFAPNSTNNAAKVNVGYGFVDPLTKTYGSGSTALTLRGLGRCPTLSSLTVVFYVSGFGFKTPIKDASNNPISYIDYDETPDDQAGDKPATGWLANFKPGSSQWANVNSERIRAFVVPCTFQPGCGYPEVSDACTVSISGLNNIQLTATHAPTTTSPGGFFFPDPATSILLGTPFQKLPPERAWGGNEGPLAWLLTADALASKQTLTYPFAGPDTSAGAFVVPWVLTTSSYLDPKTGNVHWPPAYAINFAGANLTVTISDVAGNTLQRLNVNLPAFTTLAPYSSPAPTINGECSQADVQPPGASDSKWTTDATCAVQPSWYMTLAHRILTSPASRAVMIQAGDVTRSVEAGTDMRVMAALSSVPASMVQPHPDYTWVSNNPNEQGGTFAHNLRFADGTSVCFAPGPTDSDNLTPKKSSYAIADAVNSVNYPNTATTLLTVADWRGLTPAAYYNFFPAAPCSVPTGLTGAMMSGTLAGDWDTGPGCGADGALINLPDAGTQLTPATAYRSLSGSQPGSATQRTPNALVPSPVIFGSLPSGVNPADSVTTSQAASIPWRTLLFCPYPAANTSNTPCDPKLHPGAASPPDYLILDNFWMPVVEPYAISTCMATAGKVNLNDQIVPFTYLHRSTALRALLDDLRIPALPMGVVSSYKSTGPPIDTSKTPIWNAVDENQTVTQIENKFAGGSVDAYLSESEICSVPLVPLLPLFNPNQTPPPSVAATQAALSSFWSGASNPDGGLTGDNLRELPYAQLYGRLTTRSNSYTVHVRVQVLKKLAADPKQNVWNEGDDLVLGDWRGSYEIERFLDSNAPAPAAGTPLGGPTAAATSGYYKFRIVSSHAFVP